MAVLDFKFTFKFVEKIIHFTHQQVAKQSFQLKFILYLNKFNFHWNYSSGFFVN